MGTEAKDVANTLPEGFIPETDPAVPLMEKGGYGSLITTKVPAIQAQGPDFAGPPQAGATIADYANGRVAGRMKTQSAAQQKTAADEKRAADKEAADESYRKDETAYRQGMLGVARQNANTAAANATTKATAAKPLPYQAAENAASLNTAEVEGVKVLKALRQSGLDQSNSPADPRWQKFVVTTLKIAPEDFQKADIQQRVAFVNAALTRQLMGGRPSQYVAQILQQHLPQGEMSGQQLTHVLHNVLQQTGERRTELQQMLPGIKGPASGQSYADYLTELANGTTPNTTQVGGFTVRTK
jgi:hypothetical protein